MSELPENKQDAAAALAPAERYRAPALDKGLDILELLAEQPLGLTRAEIVRAMGRSQSEIYRMLERLVARGYVWRSAGGERYSLSLKLFSMATRHPPLNRLVARARPVMEAFAAQAEQSCHFGVFDRGRILIVAQVDGPGYWSLAVRMGAQLPIAETASGLVMLAFQDDETRQHMLSFTRHPPPQGLAAIAGQGYWAGVSRQSDGVTDISCPVLDTAGHAIGVLTCPYLGRRDGHDVLLNAAIAHLRAAAQHLSLQHISCT